MNPFIRHKKTTECVINGIRQYYDAMSCEDIQKAKDYYEPLGFMYIGSSSEFYVENVKQSSNTIRHFFVNKKSK